MSGEIRSRITCNLPSSDLNQKILYYSRNVFCWSLDVQDLHN